MFVYLLCAEVVGKLKTVYLLAYNGIQWSCFILVVVTLLKLLRGGLGEPCYEAGSMMHSILVSWDPSSMTRVGAHC